MKKEPPYTMESNKSQQLTEKFDTFYTKFATIYDLSVKLLPVWKTWIRKVIPYMKGPRVLEISCGTGYLITQYANEYETYGLDYNTKMVSLTKKNLDKKGVKADIQQANVELLPYKNEVFDTLVNTMAFSGYRDGMKAMAEMYRVLKKGGRLLVIDVGYPKNKNRIGITLTRFWALTGDIIRNMDKIFTSFNLDYKDIEIGGYGSVHLYVAEKSYYK